MDVDDMAQLREEYRRASLEEAALDQDPLATAGRWFQEAIVARSPEPTAVTLATVDPDGRPDARTVLLRSLDAGGAVWFTNYHSAKGRQLEGTSDAAVVAWWPVLERQLRLRGRVSQVDTEVSDAYFASRPRGSQLAAWASAQSEPIADRAALEQRLQDMEARFDGAEVPRPPHWGGYRLTPVEVEFWQGRPSRLHDRLRCRLVDGGWVTDRLQP